MLELEAEVRAFAGALDSLGQTYRPSLNETNFSEQLQQRKALAEQRCPCAPPSLLPADLFLQ